MCNRKREILEEWTSEMDFRLCNVGNTFTCVRPQGSSIPDITWCSPSYLNRISHWPVLLGMESFLDHAYISFRLRFGVSVSSSRSSGNCNYPRWSWKDYDKDLLNAVF